MKPLNLLIFILLISSVISACSTKISYVESDKLPQEYKPEMAQKNGDVVSLHGINYSNIEKLDKFIDRFKNKKANISDTIRITTYTIEGDAIIQDLTITAEASMKLRIDYTRDKFGSADIIEYNIVDIFTKKEDDQLYYMVTIDKSIDIILFAIKK